MLDSMELEVFLAVSETQSLSGAARNLHLRRRTVSQRIQNLEKRWQVELFDRRGDSLVLTGVGKELLPLAKRIADLSARIEAVMAAGRDNADG